MSSHLQPWCKFIRLALPILVAELLHLTPTVVDTIMAGRYSAVDLAGVSVGGSILAAVTLFMVGVIMGTTPSVAHLYGAKQLSSIGGLVQQSLWLALACGLLGTGIAYMGNYILLWIDMEVEVRRVALGYLNAAMWSIPAMTLMQSLRSFSEGMGITRPMMYFGLLIVAINIPLNYILIYGKLGLPALGGIGCGWATSISVWLSLLGMYLYVYYQPAYRASGFFGTWTRVRWSSLQGLIKVGLPIGVSIFIEATMFSVIALFLAAQPETVLAAHQLVLNFTSMLFMIPLSIGIAATIAVGQAIGRRDQADAKNNAVIAYSLALGIALLTCLTMLTLPAHIASIYSTDIEVIKVATQLFFLAAMFQFSDALQVASAGILRGLKDTRWPMVIVVIAYWCIGLPLGYLLGLTEAIVSPLGAGGFWIGLIAGLSLAGLLLFIRVVRKLFTQQNLLSQWP